MRSPLSKTTSHRLIHVLLTIIFTKHFLDLKTSERSTLLRKAALKRRRKTRYKWSHINLRISDNHFRRMFRMTRKCFELLSQTIIDNIGENNFKSEEYISTFIDNEFCPLGNRSYSMYCAHCHTSGGYISGEIKLAVAIRLLAGGDALDLCVLFDIGHRWCKQILYDVLENWIVAPNLGGMDIEKYLSNDDELERVSTGFSKRSNGLLTGAIGAIDGWLVKIQRPNFPLDGCKNIVGFFSRKGFYALNVQCLVDHNKKVLWASYDNRGSSHDSTCFRDTQFYKLLKLKAVSLLAKQRFILGDSAYAIESFIIPPYDLAGRHTAEDDFNFYHSSARITVECAFGEIDLCWGIFWKRLTSSLAKNILICEGAMHLHNFLVEYRNNCTNSERENALERAIFNDDIRDNAIVRSVVGNDNNRGDGGRPTFEEKESRLNGIKLRNDLKNLLRSNDMHRPRNNEQ